jgi:colanic acid biosynthesis glycosyl transferase WcaI
MRILINGTNYHPEKIGIGKYTGELAEWLAAQGHEVRVVTAPPYYPEWNVSVEYSAWKYRRERVKGVDVWRCPLWVPKKPSGLKRLLHLASFALSCLPVMLLQILWKPDVVLVIEPPLMCAPIAWMTAKLCGAKTWLHVQDFEVDAAFDMGILRSLWLKSLVLGIEGWLLSCFERVSTISDKMLEKLNAKGVNRDKRFLFLNWVDLDDIRPLDEESVFRSQLKILPSQVVALYSGNMGEKQGLEIVLDAAFKLDGASNICFVLCGDGAARLRLQKKYSGLSNVIWLPLQPLDMLNQLLNLADIHLLPQRGDVADLVMPSKLLGMLASARPILTTAGIDTQVGGIVMQCGMLSPASDAYAFLDALINMAVDPVRRKQWGLAGRMIAENQFSKSLVLRHFENELTKILGH